MPVKTLALSRNGAQPQVSVFIGQAQFGRYEVSLKTAGGWQVQGKGDNLDDIADVVAIGTPLAHLEGTALSWWVTVAAPDASDGQLYFVRVSVQQGGSAVPEGTFEYSGPLANTHNIIDVVRLTLA
jgi:hypothetical protein